MSKKKSKTAATRACPECGGVMRYETRDDAMEYKGHVHEVETNAWWCTSCGEAVLDGDALAAREKAFLDLRAQVDAVLSPAEVVEVRKRLGISQRRAGEVLGGGPRAFQKYEKGTVAVSAPMSNLLRLLSEDPKRLEELKHRNIAPSETIASSTRSKSRNVAPRKGAAARARVRTSR